MNFSIVLKFFKKLGVILVDSMRGPHGRYPSENYMPNSEQKKHEKCCDWHVRKADVSIRCPVWSCFLLCWNKGLSSGAHHRELPSPWES